MSSTFFLCDKCPKAFTSLGNLNRHGKKHENNALIGRCFEECFYKCFEGCLLSFKHCTDLKNHLMSEHDFHFTSHCFEFSTFEVFTQWLQELEKTENVRFFKPRGPTKKLNGTIEKFVLMCYRSGKRRVIPERNLKRNRKTTGYLKSNFYCTCQIFVTKYSTNQCYVEYCSTHYGHDVDLQDLQIPKKRRKKHIMNGHMSALVKTYNITSSQDNIYEVNDKEKKYIVKKVNFDNDVCCMLTCNYCNICIHTFECTCLDYSIRATICKHIHFVMINNNKSDNLHISQAENEVTHEIENKEENEIENDVDNEVENNVEIKDIVNSLSAKNNQKKPLQNWPNKIEIKLLKLLKNIHTLKYTEEEYERMFEVIQILNHLGSTSLSENITPSP